MGYSWSVSKEDLSLLPLRINREDALRGYLFLIFISLIVYMELQKKIGSVEISSWHPEELEVQGI